MKEKWEEQRKRGKREEDTSHIDAETVLREDSISLVLECVHWHNMSKK